MTDDEKKELDDIFHLLLELKFKTNFKGYKWEREDWEKYDHIRHRIDLLIGGYHHIWY